MGKIIIVASGKGGTGKTTVTANIGAALAMRGNLVALVDMDMGCRNLDITLGLESSIVYETCILYPLRKPVTLHLSKMRR